MLHLWALLGYLSDNVYENRSAVTHETLTGTNPSPVPGVNQKPGVVWTPNILAFMGALRALVPSSIPLVVTSGERTVAAQAAALETKLRLGDDLTKIYVRGNGPAMVADILEGPATASAIGRVLQGYKDRGILLSSHMSGLAVDLRSRGLTEAEIARIVQDGQLLGGSVLVEKTPAHIHIGTRGASLPVLEAALEKAGAAVDSIDRPPLLPVIGLGLGLGLLLRSKG